MKQFIVVIIFLISVSCTNKPQPIVFGTDNCDFCKMTIMDNKFGGEIITKKGKVSKFDAIECMVSFMKKNHVDSIQFTQLLVVDYSSPETLINASTANFLHSENVPSPMGEGLSAFSGKESLDKILQQSGGESMNWTQVFNYVQ